MLTHDSVLYGGTEALLPLLVVSEEDIDDSPQGSLKGQLVYYHRFNSLV